MHPLVFNQELSTIYKDNYDPDQNKWGGGGGGGVLLPGLMKRGPTSLSKRNFSSRRLRELSGSPSSLSTAYHQHYINHNKQRLPVLHADFL